MPSYIGSYDGKGDPDNFLHLFKGAIQMQKWLMLVACHMFAYTLKDSARICHREKLTRDASTVHNIKQTDRGQKNKDRFSPYWGPNHGLLPSLSKSPKEILATEIACKNFEHSKDVSEKTKSSDTLRGETKKDKGTAPIEASILMVSQEVYIAKSLAQENTNYGGKEIIFPPVAKVNNAPVIIEAKIFGRKVGRVYMDSESSCEIIYEHCFEKLNPTIKATKVDLKTPLVGFSGERSWSIGEVLLEITIGDAPLLRTETLNFVIVRSDSSHNML
ncbi:hypothetical protein Tco_1568157 [Tanacetum coccineum]